MKTSKKTLSNPIDTSITQETDKFLSKARELNLYEDGVPFSIENVLETLRSIKLQHSATVLEALLEQKLINNFAEVMTILETMAQEEISSSQIDTEKDKKTHLLQERGDEKIPSIRRVPASDKLRNSENSVKQKNTPPIAAQVAIPQSQTAKSLSKDFASIQENATPIATEIEVSKTQPQEVKNLSDYLKSVKRNRDDSFHEHDIIEGLKKIKSENPIDEVFALIDNGISQEKAFSVLEKFNLSNTRRESAEKSTKKYDHLLAVGNYIDGVITYLEDQSRNVPLFPGGVTVEDLEKDPMFDVLIEKLSEMDKIPEGLLDRLGLEMDATDLKQPIQVIAEEIIDSNINQSSEIVVPKTELQIPAANAREREVREVQVIKEQPSKQNLSQTAEKPVVPKPQLIKRKRRNFFSQFTRKFQQSKLEKVRETLKLKEQLEIYKAQDQDLRDVRNAISGIVKEKPQSSILGKIKSSVAPDLEVNSVKYIALREKISQISSNYTLTSPESKHPSPKDVKKLLNDVKKSLKSCEGYNKPANKGIFKTIAQKITKVAYLIVGRKAIYDRKQTASFVDKVKKDAEKRAQHESEEKKR